MSRPDEQPQIDLSGVAEEPPEESADHGQEPVGAGEPDVGDTVPPDQAQSAHAPEPDPADELDPGQPLLGAVDSPSKQRSGDSER